MKEDHTNLYIRLIEYMSTLTKDNVDFYISQAMINKLDEFSDVTSDQIAYLANTTAPSITKFCQKLGYRSFNELIHDIDKHSDDSLFYDLFTTPTSQLDIYMNQFFMIEQTTTQNLINALDHKLIKELALKIKQSKHIMILAADYNHNIISFYSEILSMHHITLTVINRNIHIDTLYQISKSMDLIILSSLSASWLHDKDDYVQLIYDHFYLISTINALPDRTIYPDQSIHIFDSYYLSQRYLQIVFILINYYLINQ